jgi:predicted ATP-grasp superfamily ATP-dependent carboligase
MLALDVCSLEDLRGRVHEGMGGEDVAAREAEEEFEEWLASVLARKERKEEVKRMVEREMREAKEREGHWE